MRRLLLINVLVVISLHTYGRKIQGTIFSNGNSREVTFIINVPFLADEPNFQRVQYKVRYFDEAERSESFAPMMLMRSGLNMMAWKCV